jgi:3-phenylpropionate/trans-cinnamate dioxygenase ferredoxin reductase subunit
VSLADGSRIGYAKLLLTTGSSPRRLSVPGAGLDGVLCLRNVGDSDRIKAAFQSSSRVDAQLRSSDPDIYAAGDVANAFHPLLGKHIRVEHWANALYQPQAAARAMLGQDVAYDRVLAGMNVNIWGVNDAIQGLVRAGQPVDTGALRDPERPMESLTGR